MLKSILIYSFLFLFGYNVIVLASDVEFQNYNINDGLSQSTVRCIYQDDIGFLWFGTQEGGLNRFDGNEFVKYRHAPNDSASISSNKVFKMVEDGEGNLWLATSSGVCKFSKNLDTFTSYINYNSDWREVSNTINDICIDDGGNLWIGANNGLFHISKSSHSIIHKFKNIQYVKSIYKARNGDLWIGAQEGLFQFNNNTEKLELFINSSSMPKNVNQVYGDSKNRIWISTFRQGLFCIENSTKKKYVRYIHDPLDNNSINSNEVRCVLEDGHDKMWVGTDKGLSLLDVKNKIITRYYEDDNNPYSLSKNSVYSLYKDNTKKIWVGTWNGGVNYISSKDGRILHESHRINDEKSLNNNTVKCFYPEENGVWIGTQKGGLNYFNKQTGKYTHYMSVPADKSTIASNHIFSIEKDPSGNLWVGTNNGLSNFNIRTKKFTNYFNGQRVLKVLHYKDNKLWVCFADEISLVDIEKGEIIHTPIHENNKKIYGSNLQLIFKYNNGKIRLVSTNGVFEYNVSNREFELISLPASILAENFRSIYCTLTDRYGTIWIGSETGLHFLKENQKSIQSVTKEKESIITEVKGILDDSQGNLWLSTNSGIYKFNPRSNSTVHFSVNDGLQSNEFINTSCAKNAKGEMYFGGINGYNIFHPEMLKFDDTQVKTVLVGFQLFNKEVEIGTEFSPLIKSITYLDEITLNHKQNVFTIKYSALYYDKRKNQKYTYKLVGHDNNWNYVDNKRTASYMNLPPGEYHFLVKSTNKDGTWSNSNAALKINVLPPFWKTWWFRTILILFITGMIVTIFHLRIQSINRQKAILEEQIHERTQDLKEKNTVLEQQKTEIFANNEALSSKNEEILRQRNELVKLNEEIQEINKLKLRFFTNISHEFRTPLTLILGPLDKLKDINKKNEEAGNLLGIVQRNSQRLLVLINRLMDFRRLEQGKMNLSGANFDLVAFVKEIKNAFNILAKQQHITYNFSSNTDKLIIFFDPQKMEAVFYNLLSNAFKHTPKNGIIDVSIHYIEKQNEKVEIIVSDTGKGIAKPDQDLIFERFMQVDSSESQVHKGSGIGLAYTREILDLHEGKISLESELNKGSSFIVELPVKTIDSEQQENNDMVWDSLSDNSMQELKELVTQLTENSDNEESILPQQRIVDESKPTVLVIDDNIDIRAYLKVDLHEYYNILEANNGKKGLQIAAELNPDCIVSDVVMPAMDGFEVCSRIKQDINISHIPVILLTAYTSDIGQIHGFKAGADDYVSKPFNCEVLRAKIDSLLANRKLLQKKFQQGINIEPKEISVTSADEVFLKGIIDIVDENMSEIDFNVEKLTEIACVSNAHLYRKLSSLTGLTPSEFIRSMRIKRAAKLLKTGELRVFEVMDITGFDGRAAFNSNFKKQFNMTPSEYVKSFT